MSALTFTKVGVKAQTQVKLDPGVFSVKEINQTLIHQAYNTYLKNGRENLAKTKTRGLISGGGRKPHPQKGTGRARSGSSRNPLWRGGGTVFGPTGFENYSRKINTKAKRAALVHALSAFYARSGDNLFIIEELALKAAKTKDLSKLLAKLNLLDAKCLIVADAPSPELRLASRNMSGVSVSSAQYLNIAKIIDADRILITKQALHDLSAWLNPTPKTVAKESKWAFNLLKA